MKNFLVFCLCVAFCSQLQDQTREWSDKTGNFKLEADLIARNEKSVVLEGKDKNLLIVDIDDLCDADKKYLESKEASKADGEQTFTMANGLKVKAKVLEFGRRDVTIKGGYGRIHVNDRLLKNLPEVYRKMVFKIVDHFEKKEFDSERDLSKWIALQKGASKTYTLDGVLLELENGDHYGIPFFLFSEKDQAALKPGFEDWIKAEKKDDYREDLALQLRTQSMIAQRQRAASLQMQRLSLNLAAYRSGLLWQVEMLPPVGYAGMAVRVVVPGQNSEQAAFAARSKYPNYRVGAIARLNRRGR